jgi:hypothetical protein
MMTPTLVKDLVESKKEYLAFNAELIDIFENNLSSYIEADLKKQLSPKSYEQAKYRISPINILPKYIDKLTNIYHTSVLREVVDGTAQDTELLAWYEEEMKVNDALNCSNEFYNLCKASLIYPTVRDGEPHLLVIQNNQFVVYSDDPTNPTKPTHVIILAGRKDQTDIYWVWSKDAFFISDSDGKLRPELMAEYNNAAGINPIGRLPFVYVNDSKYKLCPTQDMDMLKVIKLIPVMLTDLNLAAMFQSFSITYGINLDDENLAWAPNAFWRLKSDNTTDAKPEIGTIKPEVDYDQVLGLIEAELSMWLGTKGIRASTVGSLNKDNYSSGISKIIDEMDTVEARQKQVTKYQDVEHELWELVLGFMHPYWVNLGLIDNVYQWSPGASVKTTFAVQLPAQTRGQVVTDMKEEFSAGFISRRRAIAKLNPEFSATEIDELIKEIDEERTLNVSTENQPGDTPGSETPAA